MAVSAPTLEDLKRHMKIRHSHEDEDLQEKLAAATEAASDFLNRPIPWLAPEQPDTGGPVYAAVPYAVRAAILIMAAEMIANREASVVGTIYTPIPTAQRLLWPHRVGLGV
ncbi:head-tail connector protein [Metapseudomonas otitidis]|uniref:head-tail connector protein n=1 Tax=Metapseudomonas otitidis TaxID=319939 RepID=UPI0039FD9A4B